MHNCRETKEQITELLLDGADGWPEEVLSAELRSCAECRSEFDALKATLSITTRLSEISAPSESYWMGYHAKLRQRIKELAGESHAKAQRRQGEPSFFFAALRLCVRTTVPVPVPLIIIVAAVLLAFVMRTPEQPIAQTIRVPVEVPVVQERVVTRVVYRERKPSAKRTSISAKVESTFAKSRKPQNDIPPSLLGFKPTEEVKLTVIKGGSGNEK